MSLVVSVKGGLGNQMFQYALGRKLALLRGTELFLDLSFYDLEGEHTKRAFELDVFNVTYERATPQMLRPYQRIRSSRLRRMVPLSSHRIFNERGFPFDPGVFDVSVNTCVDGYWQSEKYFHDVNDTIRQDFSFRDRPTGQVRELLDRIKGSNAVSLHVRRGDYITSGTASQYYQVCDADYYTRGMDLILQKSETPALFIFSDDITWAREVLRFSVPTTFVDLGSSIGDWNDLRLMSQCRHHIIANSSFSWWGAWLNPDPNKLVIAPRRWFTDPTIHTRDLIPAGWITL